MVYGGSRGQRETFVRVTSRSLAFIYRIHVCPAGTDVAMSSYDYS